MFTCKETSEISALKGINDADLHKIQNKVVYLEQY